jgi:phosphoribosyl 1,2-cyclic phosphodiesterase
LKRQVNAQYDKWNIFKAGDNIIIEDAIIETLSIPHDAYDPVAIIVHHATASVGFFTDLGYAPRLVLEKARKCTALLLESNYDVKMLQADTKRPWAVKQRIQARHGHLSNEAACQFLREIISEKLRYLFLGHLSEDCNCPKMVRSLFENELRILNRLDIQLHVAEQHALSPTLRF